MKKIISLSIASSLISFTNHAQTVTDHDGNVYNTASIGTQLWMADNLHVIHYNDGSLIPLVSNSTTWGGLTSGARCYYNNDSLTNAAKYGSLYNWYTVVDSRGMCPVGWHIPSDAEFGTLLNYLGGINVAGGPLKDTGYTRWNSPNTGATNSSGFTGVGGGNRSYTGSYYSLGGFGDYWATTSATNTARGIALHYSSIVVANGWTDKKFGFSVRCLSDTLIATSINEIHDQGEMILYPNPTNGEFTIMLPTGKAEITVTNILGEQVINIETTQTTIDLQLDNNGVYIVYAKTKQGVAIRKLVVSR